MKTSAIAVLAILCGACASLPDQASDSREAREYRTGSNLPLRDRSAAAPYTIDKPALEDWRIPPAANSLSRGP